MNIKLEISNRFDNNSHNETQKYPQAPSPLNTTAISNRRGPFIRKPTASPVGRFAQKKRKSLERSAIFQKSEGFHTDRPKVARQEETPSHITKLKLAQKSTLNQDFIDESQNSLYNSSFSERTLLGGIKYIHWNNNKLPFQTLRQTSTHKNSQQGSNVLKESIIEQELKRKDRNFKPQKRLLKIADQSSQSCLNYPPRQYKRELDHEKQCKQCKKHLQRVRYLQEKQKALTQELLLKDDKISKLAIALQDLQKQQKSQSKYQSDLIASLQQRIKQGEDQLLRTFETAKHQISKLRYVELQNRMLLRYKSECQQANDQNKRLKEEYNKLKRQMLMIARMSRKELNLQQKSKGDDSKGCKYTKKCLKEEDLISLEYSQCSQEHI